MSLTLDVSCATTCHDPEFSFDDDADKGAEKKPRNAPFQRVTGDVTSDMWFRSATMWWFLRAYNHWLRIVDDNQQECLNNCYLLFGGF